MRILDPYNGFMNAILTKVVSNVKRDPRDPSAVFVGPRWMDRIRGVRFQRGGLGERKLYVQHSNGREYVITQADRTCFFVEGPHINGAIDVDGWSDGVRMLNDM